MTDYKITDAAKSWDTDEWNDYGLISYPSPLEKVSDRFVHTGNTGTIDGLNSGYGLGNLDDGTGTYSVTFTNYVHKDTVWVYCKPNNSGSALSVLAKEAVSASYEEAITLKYNSALNSGLTQLPQVNVYMNLGSVPIVDIRGLVIRVQAAKRHASMTNDIKVQIFVYDTVNDDGSGTWEDLGIITQLDANNDGIWGWVSDTFGLNGNTDGYTQLAQSDWNKYTYTYKEYSGGSATGTEFKVVRLRVYGEDDCNTNNGWGINVGMIGVTPLRAGADVNQYKITDTVAPSNIYVVGAKKYTIVLYTADYVYLDEDYGDLSTQFAAGLDFEIIESTDNDADYTISAVLYTGGKTRITVAGSPFATGNNDGSVRIQPTNYIGEGDNYLIGQSVSSIFDDFDDATYGASNYSFSFSDTTVDGLNIFTGADFNDQRHINVLTDLVNFANKTWWYSPVTDILYFADTTDITSSGVTLSSTNIPPGAAYLEYPQDEIIGKVIAKGNKTLGVTYTKTGTSDGTQEIVLKLPHITSYAELKIYADNIFEKYSSRQPHFRCKVNYDDNSDFVDIKIGTTVDVTWKNLSSETLDVQRLTTEWTRGNTATMIIEAGVSATPPEEKITNKINDIQKRLDQMIAQGAIYDYDGSSGTTIQINTSPSEGIADAVLRDGSTVLTGDWDAGGYYIRAKNFYYDNDDADYYFKFGGTATANRTWTFQDSSDTFVGLATTDVLTNKTLTSPDINGGTVDAITSLTVANNVDIGAYELRAQTFESDVTTGTIPLVIASTTLNTNLNADLWDGNEFADYIDQAVKQASDVIFNDITVSTPSNIYSLSHDSFADFVANEHIDWTSTNENLNTSGTTTLTGVVQIGAVKVNLANGTTYYLDDDGDAVFKDVFATNIVATSDNQHKIVLDAQADTMTLHAGDEAADNFLSIKSPGTQLELGTSGNRIWIGNATPSVGVSGSWCPWDDQWYGNYDQYNFRAKNQTTVWVTLDTTSLTILAGNLIMNGASTDDERLKLPYLTQVPGSADNGSIWVEADGLHGYLAGAERNLSRPHCLSTYIDIKERQAVWNIHGGIISISTANALDSDPTDITDTIGIGKIIVVINAGGDVTGEITVTGTTVDRDTGAETGADTDTLTVDTLSTDNSGTDGGGNITYAFVDAYMTAKWFKGAVTLSTSNLTLSDVDIYQCSFEQFNDLPNVTIDTFDTNQLANNAAANIYWHLYSVKPTGDKLVLAKEKSMELTAADVSANLYYRLRRGNLAISIDGTTQGFFVQCYPEPLANIYWEDINLKIWYY